MNKIELFISHYFEIDQTELKKIKKEWKKSKSKLPLFEYVYCKKNNININSAESFYIKNRFVEKCELSIEKTIKDNKITRYQLYKYFTLYKPVLNISLEEYINYLEFDLDFNELIVYKKDFFDKCTLQEYKEYKTLCPKESYDFYKRFKNQTRFNDVNTYKRFEEAEVHGVSLNDYQTFLKTKNKFNLSPNRLNDILLIDKYDLTLEELDLFKNNGKNNDPEDFFLDCFAKNAKTTKNNLNNIALKYGLNYKDASNLIISNKCSNKKIEKLLYDIYEDNSDFYSYFKKKILSKFTRKRNVDIDFDNLNFDFFKTTENERIVFNTLPTIFELMFCEFLKYKEVVIAAVPSRTLTKENIKAYKEYGPNLSISFNVVFTKNCYFDELNSLKSIKTIIIKDECNNSTFKNYLLENVQEIIFENRLNDVLDYKDIVIPSNVVKLKLPLGFRVIYDVILKPTNSLKELVIPPTIEYIDPKIKFNNDINIYCSSLSSTIFARSKIAKSKLKIIKDEEKTLLVNKQNFNEISKLEDKYVYTKVIFENNITEIKNDMFMGFVNLKNVEFPNSLKKIGKNAFRLCRSLVDLTIPNTVESIGNAAFKNSGIQFLRFSNSLKVIPTELCENCYYLTVVSGHSNVEKVEKDAFRNCTVLKSLVFPVCTRHIEYCIAGCESLTTFVVTNDLDYFEFKPHPYLNHSNIKSFVLPKDILRINITGYGYLPKITSLRGTNYKKMLKYDQPYNYLNGEEFSELVNEYLYSNGFNLLIAKERTRHSDIVFDNTSIYKSDSIKNVTHTSATFVVNESTTNEKLDSKSYIVANSDDTSTNEFKVETINFNFSLNENLNFINSSFKVTEITINSYISPVDITVNTSLDEKCIIFALLDEQMKLASDYKKVTGVFKKGSKISLQFNIEKDACNGKLYLICSKGEEFSIVEGNMKLNIIFRLMDDLDLF